MNRSSQLARLILDFYRENQRELEQLKPLEKCEVFRRWGSLHIRCQSIDIAQAIVESRAYLETPLLELRLVRKIKIFVGRKLVALFAVGSSEPIELLHI
jgi:hypothetical protein